MGDYKLWINDDGIIRCVLWGVHLEQDAESITEGIVHLSRGEGRARVLIDLRKTERSTSGARRVYVDTIKAEPELFEKLALFGTSAMNGVMADFIMTGSGRKDKVRCFESEEDALRWLKE